MSLKPAGLDISGYGNEVLTEAKVSFHGLDIYGNFQKETAVTRSFTHEARHLLSENDTGPYMFDFAPLPKGHYYDLDGANLELTFQIVNSKGESMKATDVVGLVNNPLASMFKSSMIDIQNQPMSSLTFEGNPYINYFTNLLSYSKDAAETHMITQGWILDAVGQMNNVSLTDKVDTDEDGTLELIEVNDGFISRRKMLHSGKCTLIGKPPHPIFYSDRCLHGDIGFRLTLNRNSDRFVLLTDTTNNDEFRIVFKDVRISIPVIIATDNITRIIENGRDKKIGKLGFKFPSFHHKQFNRGTSVLQYEYFLSSRSPQDVLVAFVKSSAYLGDMTQNPYKFESCQIQEARLLLGSEQIPTRPYTCNFETKECRVLYKTLLDALGYRGSDTGTQLTYERFLTDTPIFMFTLVPDSCAGYHIHKNRTGQMLIEFKLKSGLADNMTMIVIMNYSSAFTYSKSQDPQVEIGFED